MVYDSFDLIFADEARKVHHLALFSARHFTCTSTFSKWIEPDLRPSRVSRFNKGTIVDVVHDTRAVTGRSKYLKVDHRITLRLDSSLAAKAPD
jgi:hypothetical protein